MSHALFEPSVKNAELHVILGTHLENSRHPIVQKSTPLVDGRLKRGVDDAFRNTHRK